MLSLETEIDATVMPAFRLTVEQSFDLVARPELGGRGAAATPEAKVVVDCGNSSRHGRRSRMVRLCLQEGRMLVCSVRWFLLFLEKRWLKVHRPLS